MLSGQKVGSFRRITSVFLLFFAATVRDFSRIWVTNLHESGSKRIGPDPHERPEISVFFCTRVCENSIFFFTSDATGRSGLGEGEKM